MIVNPTWFGGIGAPFGLGWITDPLVNIKNVATVICEEEVFEVLVACGAAGEADFPLEFPVIVVTIVMVVTVVIVETIVDVPSVALF